MIKKYTEILKSQSGKKIPCYKVMHTEKRIKVYRSILSDLHYSLNEINKYRGCFNEKSSALDRQNG